MPINTELNFKQNTDDQISIVPEDREDFEEEIFDYSIGNIDVPEQQNRVRRNGNANDQLIKSQSARNQRKMHMKILEENEAVFDIKEFDKGIRINSIKFGDMVFTRQQFSAIIQNANNRFKMVKQQFGNNFDLNQLLQMVPDMKSDALIHELLKIKKEDIMIDNQFDNLMMDLLEYCGFTIELNKKRYPKDETVETLMKEIGDCYHQRVIETIKNSDDQIVFMGKNVVYELNGHVYCQGIKFNNLYVDQNGQLKYHDIGVDDFFKLGDKIITFKNSVATVCNKHVKFTQQRGFYVQTKGTPN